MSTDFTPRLLADGRVCCSSPNALCPKCTTHHARVAAAPPDPYAAARRDTGPARHTSGFAPPDPYAADLAKRRKENR